MFKHINKIIAPKSAFTRNFFILFRGTLIAQLIPIIITPVLTRIYSPTDFGIFELFLSVSLVLGMVVNLRYELALVLPEKDEDAWNIMGLGLVLSLAISVFLFILVSFFADGIVSLLNNSEIKFWLYFVPLAVLFQGVFNMLNYYHIRQKQFKNISNANISRATLRTGLQLLIGFFRTSAAGLIIGQIVGFFTGAVYMLKNVNVKEIIQSITWKGMKDMAKKYQDFPKYTFPSTLANNLAVNMLALLIAGMFSIASVGFYSLANRILGLPSSLIGKSMSNVYYKEAIDQRKKNGNAISVFFNTMLKLFIISLPIFIVVFVFAEDLFAIVFGEEWRIAGEYAKILIPLIFIRFIVAPVSVSLSVFEQQKISLFWQLGLLALSIAVFVSSIISAWTIKVFLTWYVGVLSGYYVFFIFILYRVVAGKMVLKKTD